MKSYLVITALLLSSVSWSQEWAKQYDNYDDFNNGLALVSKAGKKGFVNPGGKLIVPLIYDDAMHFSDGMAAVKKPPNGVSSTAPAKKLFPVNMKTPTVLLMDLAPLQRTTTLVLLTAQEK